MQLFLKRKTRQPEKKQSTHLMWTTFSFPSIFVSFACTNSPAHFGYSRRFCSPNFWLVFASAAASFWAIFPFDLSIIPKFGHSNAIDRAGELSARRLSVCDTSPLWTPSRAPVFLFTFQNPAFLFFQWFTVRSASAIAAVQCNCGNLLIIQRQLKKR